MARPEKVPPLGVALTTDIEEVQLKGGGTSFWARVRWSDPVTGRRDGVKRAHPTRDAAEAWLDRMQGAAATGIDPGQTLADYVAMIGDRWARGIDSTSTYDPYSAGLRLRVVPALGHLPVAMVTAGLIDRAIDGWERKYGRSTVKNSIAPLVLVLDEAVRDALIDRNPAKDRARRTSVGKAGEHLDGEPSNPRDLALRDVKALDRLVVAVVEHGGHQCWGDTVTLLATTAARISEVAGLRVGDVDWKRKLIHIERQTYPGRGGLVTKPTKGRRKRDVPIIDPLAPTLERLTKGRKADAWLVRGPRGGTITTATLRDATGWDEIVTTLGYPSLVRHGLRHTALTWMADAGIDLHILQRVAGHQDPAITSRYLHPDHQALAAAGEAFSAWWSVSGPSRPALRVVQGGKADK
ncbi:MAG TPA: site-specific integrase [Jiangellaceae bacterium]